MIPQHIQPFFWDIDPNTFNPIDYPDYTILRILELGDDAAVKWLRQTFSEEAIKSVLCSDRRLSRRSATFWALAYRVPFDEVASLASKT